MKRIPSSVRAITWGIRVFVGGLLLALTVPAWAQPQAPIEWGEARLLLEIPFPPYWAGDVYCKGDTLVLVSIYNDYSGGGYVYPTACISGDNGQTWSPWRILGILGQNSWTTAHKVGFSSTAIFCTATLPGSGSLWGFYVTTDLGNSWQFPENGLPALFYRCQRGDTLFCSMTNWGPGGVVWTTDLGHSFSPPRYTGWELGIDDIGVSAAYVHAINTRMPAYVLHYARAPLLDGPFEPTAYLNEFVSCTNPFPRIAFDSEGTGMILSNVDYTSCLDHSTPWLNITRDDGATWSPPDTISVTQQSWGKDILCCGHLWIAFYFDTLRQAGFDHRGTWCRFSANNGRSWYPNQQIEGIGWDGGQVTGGYLGPDRAKVHVVSMLWDGDEHPRFFQWEGIIHPDTILPVVEPIDVPPDTVPVEAQLLFSATITDNDTLYQERLRLRSAVDTTVIVMERMGNDYFAYWTVPQEGRFWYRIEGEDFWENIGSYPDSGWATFVTEGWIDAVDEFILHPSSFSISVFPNPFNSTATFTFELPHTSPVTLSVFNTLGQRVGEVSLGQMAVGEHRYVFEAGDLPSGVYLARVEMMGMAETRKVVLLR